MTAVAKMPMVIRGSTDIKQNKKRDRVTMLCLYFYAVLRCAPTALLGNQNMTSNGLFNLCILDADIPPGDGRAAMLQKVLHQHDVMPRSVINVRSIPLAERVGRYIGQPQKVTDGL